VKHLVVDVLLVVAVVVQAGSCLGVLVMRDAYARLHYAAAATTVGPVAIAVAVVVEEVLSEQGVKAVLTAAVLLTGGAVLTHATGRAARVREHDRWVVLDEERERRA
jgi:monovalent cation/proton antiporter MnhG/PhaG subunit